MIQICCSQNVTNIPGGSLTRFMCADSTPDRWHEGHQSTDGLQCFVVLTWPFDPSPRLDPNSFLVTLSAKSLGRKQILFQCVGHIFGSSPTLSSTSQSKTSCLPAVLISALPSLRPWEAFCSRTEMPLNRDSKKSCSCSSDPHGGSSVFVAGRGCSVGSWPLWRRRAGWGWGPGSVSGSPGAEPSHSAWKRRSVEQSLRTPSAASTSQDEGDGESLRQVEPPRPDVPATSIWTTSLSPHHPCSANSKLLVSLLLIITVSWSFARLFLSDVILRLKRKRRLNFSALQFCSGQRFYTTVTMNTRTSRDINRKSHFWTQ